MRLAVFSLSTLVIILLSGVSGAGAGTYEGCERKQQAVERQLEIARRHGNTARIEGLERALTNIQAWCSEDNMKAKAEYEVWEKQCEVEERRRELEKAREDGKAKKIAKREAKLREAEAELREAEKKRDTLP